MGILPNLLALLTYAHAFHNPLSWSESNPDALKLVNRVLMDRFWQAGISTGSKDEFLKRISSTKSTVEGLASSLRSVIRNIRDYCYSALVSLSKIDPAFYQIFGLAEALATALFTDARHLSTHQMSLLLSTSFGIIGECPLESRDAFLGPMIKALLKFVDEKVSTEWDRIALRKTHRTEGESLTDEMREESILRQFTYAAIMIVANILDPEPHKTLPKSQASSSKTPPANAPRVRDFVLSSPPLIELILQFAAHCILVPDTRSCNTILRVLHSITIHFTLPNDPVHSAVREFLSENILKACITAYNDPYFVDCQRDLSMLIMAIYRYYGDLTPTPRNIFASLPGVAGARQERMERRMTQSHSDKVWRAAVVECLAGLKGVSISEMGRLTGSEVLDKRKDEKKVLKEKDEERRREAARLRTIETQAEIDEL